jgi:hypothetical protein
MIVMSLLPDRCPVSRGERCGSLAVPDLGKRKMNESNLPADIWEWPEEASLSDSSILAPSAVSGKDDGHAVLLMMNLSSSRQTRPRQAVRCAA